MSYRSTFNLAKLIKYAMKHLAKRKPVKICIRLLTSIIETTFAYPLVSLMFMLLYGGIGIFVL